MHQWVAGSSLRSGSSTCRHDADQSNHRTQGVRRRFDSGSAAWRPSSNGVSAPSPPKETPAYLDSPALPGLCAAQY